MKTSDFDYTLPEELIAQTPPERRGGSRMLVAERSGSGAVFSHRKFENLPSYLRPGDCLVLNDTRVIPARLYGHRTTGRVVEVLLLRPGREGSGLEWECLTRPGRKTRTGELIHFGAEMTGVITGELEDGVRLIKLDTAEPLMETLERLGEMPLPPYIQQKLDDSERYQTVYSRQYGSAAAPTAGLHFTEKMLDKLRSDGVEVCFVTLHVGLGTFRPVKTEDVSQHKMHTESYTIPAGTAHAVARAKESGNRVVAVGTTVCRALESAALPDGLRQGSGETDIFITPGYRFKVIDALLTNFHLPRSTLLMLVSALLGRENTLAAYAQAVNERYRFFSFGDAMLIM